MEIFDINMRAVAALFSTIDENTIHLQTASLTPGVYFFKMAFTDGRFVSAKFLVGR